MVSYQLPVETSLINETSQPARLHSCSTLLTGTTHAGRPVLDFGMSAGFPLGSMGSAIREGLLVHHAGGGGLSTQYGGERMCALWAARFIAS